jgi:hypothetical protein
MRIDCYFKNYLIEQFSFNNDEIKFAHIDSSIQIPYINVSHNTITLIPKKYYYLILEKKVYSKTHNIYSALIDNNVPLSDINYFVNTLHVCSTDLGWNPLYVQTGRKYNLEYNNELDYQKTLSYFYDINDHSFKLNYEKTIDYYNEYIKTIEKEENEKILKIIY